LTLWRTISGGAQKDEGNTNRHWNWFVFKTTKNWCSSMPRTAEIRRKEMAKVPRCRLVAVRNAQKHSYSHRFQCMYTVEGNEGFAMLLHRLATAEPDGILSLGVVKPYDCPQDKDHASVMYCSCEREAPPHGMTMKKVSFTEGLQVIL
jgi:hypothetical protein